MSDLEKAIEFATRAHRGRTGEDGEAEILHPLRVMFRLQADDERQAAVMHDVIEDCGMTVADLQTAGFSPAVVTAVEVLSGRPGETYDQYIARVLQCPLAARVKQADVEEHAAIVSRFPASNEARERLANYHRARLALSAALA